MTTRPGSSSEPRVERLAAADWERLRRLRLTALADAPDAFQRTLAEEAEFAPEAWRGRLTGDSANFMAVQGDTDVGMVACAPYRGLQGMVGLFGMWVAPSHRRSGIGKLLVEAVLAHARGLDGCEGLVLDVCDENRAAVGLYAALGFEPNGKVGFLPPPREHVREHQRVHRFEPE